VSAKVLTLKMKEEVFRETEEILRRVKSSRNGYINEAVDFFNKMHKRSLLKKRLARESQMVSSESLKVLEEFESFEENLPPQ